MIQFDYSNIFQVGGKKPPTRKILGKILLMDKKD